jgi:hypothetical protein
MHESTNDRTQPITTGTPPPPCQWSAIELWKVGAHEHSSNSAQHENNSNSTRAQEHKSTRAQEQKSTTAQQHNSAQHDSITHHDTKTPCSWPLSRGRRRRSTTFVRSHGATAHTRAHTPTYTRTHTHNSTALHCWGVLCGFSPLRHFA